MDPLDKYVTEALRSWTIQLEAGIDAAEGLQLASGICRGEARGCFEKAATAARNGLDIKQMMAALAPVMPEGERATITAAWGAGRAESGLKSVIEQRELWDATRKKIAGKLVLPAGTLVLAALIAPLPGLVIGYYGIPVYFALAGTPILTAIALAVVGITFFNKRALEKVWNDDGTPRPASGTDKTLLAIPLCAHIEVQRSLAEFGSILANLIGAGVPISLGLELSARAMRNGCYRESVARQSRVTEGGHPFAAAMGAEPERLWPREFTGAVAVGEKSGALEETLKRLSGVARERYMRAIEHVAEWTPKLIYGCVALFVIACIFMLAFGYLNMLNDLMKGI